MRPGLGFFGVALARACFGSFLFLIVLREFLAVVVAVDTDEVQHGGRNGYAHMG